MQFPIKYGKEQQTNLRIWDIMKDLKNDWPNPRIGEESATRLGSQIISPV